MKLSNHNLDEIIIFLHDNIKKFNKRYNKKIKIIIKGSWALQHKGLIDRKPNDIDLCFINNENLTDKRKFINFLVKEIEATLIREDENLITIKDKKYGKIEFILFEHINNLFLEKVKETVYIANTNFLITGKILMLNYVMSNYYLHADKREKIETTIRDLMFINKKNSFIDEFNSNTLEPVILNLINNSVFIFVFYKYDTFLWWNKEFNDYVFENNEINTFFNKIKSIFFDIGKNKKIIKFIDFNKKIIRLFFDGTINMEFLNMSNISPSGNEKLFINSIIKNPTKKSGVFKITNNHSKIIFNAHCDEVMGILINNEAFTLGTINWNSSKLLNIYDTDGKLVYKDVSFDINENYIFSVEKSNKINRAKINIKFNSSNKLIDENKIYYFCSNKETSINNFNLISRNNDNKINVLLLNLFKKWMNIKSNIIFSCSEEVNLSGIKEYKQTMCPGSFLVNLEVSEFEKWENHNILIRVCDYFTAYNPEIIDRVQNNFNEYNIPYKLTFGSGSTNVTEAIQKIPSVTISIPADSIHSMKSKISLLNIIYMLQIIYILDTELNDEK